MKKYKRSYLSINGGLVSEDNTVECPQCNRTMAMWEISDHCCEFAQLIELPNTRKKVQPVMFAGVIVGEFREQGDKLAYYLPESKTPYVVIDNPAIPQMWEEAV